MNRKDRRTFIKQAKKSGATKGTAMAYLAMKELEQDDPDAFKRFHEDDKVRIDIERITNRSNYDQMTDEYRAFIEESEGKVFTVHIESNAMISLKENPEWLFWKGDLIAVKEPVKTDNSE